jgi:deoxyribodipyrimidine photo-lyase
MPKGAAPTLLWFRQDLRLADNPALDAAIAFGRPVVATFVFDPQLGGPWAMGGAARWWLHHTLASLARALEQRGNRLILRRGRWDDVVPALVREAGAAEVHAGRLYAPWEREADEVVAKRLTALGVPITGQTSLLLHEPWAIRTQQGGPYGVYSPFSRAVFAAGEPPHPSPAPARIPAMPTYPGSDELSDWRLLPTSPDWAGGLRETWQPGEDGAAARLKTFIANALDRYGDARNLPGIDSSSKLSPHLRFGEISPRQVWHAVSAAMKPKGRAHDSAITFLKEVIWREFSYHLLWHRPEMPDEPLKQAFADFPWRENATHLRAWQQGRTGYPIVDAGMRELWHTGWMHNRVRMIAASFLIKHLLQPWQTGEAWFWDTLVDADAASNSASWQWVAGCGADAAPYFRIFNPILQGEKFDADGAYVRRWVPELALLPDQFIHRPWEAPALVLKEAGITLGRTYPMPIVDHNEARARALAALATISGEKAA